MVSMQGVSGGPSLYHFYFPDVGLGMWVPHCRSIFQQGSHEGLICCCIDPRAVNLDVSSEESQGLIRLGGGVFDVGVPPEIFGHGDPQVFGSLNMFQGVSMQCVVVHYGFPLHGYCEDLAFIWVEFHVPFSFPISKLVQIIL